MHRINKLIITSRSQQLQFKMGNTHYREQELAAYRPPLIDYRLIHPASPLSIYRHVRNAQQIMEYQEVIHNQENVDRKLQTFYARYQHPYLVSTQYLKVEEAEACTEGSYTLRIFYERAVTNLSKVNDLPFNDSLHCYLVALKGFEILFKSYGYFQVFENMFHICQKGKLKVWCNQHIYKSVPEQYLLGEGNQQDMVIKIISIIDSNTDISTKSFSMRDALIQDTRLTFASAIMNFRRICRQHRFILSEYIESLQDAAQIESLLDIYIPVSNKQQTHFDTGLTFNPSKTNRVDNYFSHKKQLNTTHDQTHPRRSRIFSPQRTPSQDSLNSSHRKPTKVQMTISPHNDGFPQFGAKRGNKSLGASQVGHSPGAQVSNRPITISYQPSGQPDLSSFRQNHSKVMDIKKRGPKQIPQYLQNEMYESKVNRIEDSPGTGRGRGVYSTPHQPHSTHSTRANPFGSDSKQLSGRLNEQPQPHPNQRPTLVRSHSEQKLQQHPQRITFSQQKPSAVVTPQRVSAPIHYALPPQSTHLNAPRIFFNHSLNSQSSNLKKSSRIISFPHNYKQHPQPSQQIKKQIQFQNNPSTIASQVESQWVNMTPENRESAHRPYTAITPVQRPQNLQANNIPSINHNRVPFINEIQKGRVSDNLYAETKTIIKQAESIPHYKLSGSRVSSQRDRSVSKQKEASLKIYEKQADPRAMVTGSLYPEKSTWLKKQGQKDENRQISQLQSKIFLLQSFASNKIMTHEFLNNQSHALSNIKWEKGSNSGHDSVTSAFKNELLLDNPSRPSLDQFDQKKMTKKESNNQDDRYDNLQTDPKLMELIREANRFSKASDNLKTAQKTSNLTPSPTYKNYEPQFNKQLASGASKGTLQPFKALEQAKNGYSCNRTLSHNGRSVPQSYLSNQPYSYDNNNKAFKKKVEPFLNKAPTIPEKWQQQNICSTSHGSTGKNYLQHIDADILEDMMAYGLDGKKKNK